MQEGVAFWVDPIRRAGTNMDGDESSTMPEGHARRLRPAARQPHGSAGLIGS